MTDTQSPEFQAAVAAAVQAEMARQLANPVPVSKPILASPRGRKPGQISEFDPRSGALVGSGWRVQMFTGKLNKCKCGSVEWGRTQEVKGEASVRSKMRPSLTSDGQLARAGWLPADSDTARALEVDMFMPEELAFTDEKRAHVEKCHKRASDLTQAEVAALEARRGLVSVA